MSRAREENGFVQILALVGLATVAGLLTLTLAQSQRTAVSLSVLERQLVADTTASSAARLLLSAINDPADDLEVRVGFRGEPLVVQVAGEEVQLALEGEAGKIDVLAADMALMGGYIERAGLPAAERERLLASLAAARATDDGLAAIEALYIHLLPIGAGASIEQDFTTRSGLAGVDPNLANERVLRAVPDLSDAEVTAIVTQRDSDPYGVRELSRHFASGRPQFTIVATVPWAEGERFTRRVPIEITTGGRALVLSGFL